MSLCRCGSNWSGFSMAHCVACHLTFTTVSNFDRHNRQGCVDPSTVGLVQVERDGGPAWAMPGTNVDRSGWAA